MGRENNISVLRGQSSRVGFGLQWVGRMWLEAQHLCGPAGTSRGADGGKCAGSMEGTQQQGEPVGGGSI